MSSVADELAELRKRSLAKTHAAKLKQADGLSTPEAEAMSIKDTNLKNRAATYTKDAVETLNAGSKAIDRDLDFKVQQSAKKKEDQKKRREATLSNNAGTKAVDKHLDFHVQKFAEKKGNKEKQKDATKNLQTFKGAPAATQLPAPSAAPSGVPEATLEPTDDVEQPPELDEIPDLGPVVADADTAAPQPPVMQPPAPRVQNRAEKKARKMMERLGMKVAPGISRVTLKMRGNQGYYTIHQPDVFEKNGAYIIFGEAKQGSGMPQMQQQQAQAVQQLETPVEQQSAETSEADEAVDEGGQDPKDIELVVSQAGCSRAKAVAALKENGGDLVNAIMSLTT